MKKIEFWYENTNDDDFYIVSSTGFDTKWHMATMIFDEKTLTLKAYIDRKLLESKVFNSKPYDNGEEFWIAQGNNGYFNGLIDDLRIYNRALNESEIEELYKLGQKEEVNLTSGLVAHYEFEGDTNDSSGNGNHGTEHGGVSYVDGVIGQAGSF